MKTAIIKSNGHCYDGCGWRECIYWDRTGDPNESRCLLFGCPDGVKKYASESLHVCNTVYGLTYEGEA